jgi:SAM-dependent methyltransferase
VTPVEKIKRNYERLPYPGADPRIVEGKGGSLPPLRWMQGLGRPGQPKPERVLVAGCGTGAEAFVIRRHLPKAEIVAVDFSPRSIAVAQRLQRGAKLARPITFAVADLTDPELPKKLGHGFDLITCHGVLSYIPEPAPVLENFAAVLNPGGALYLGVNGESHPALRVREWLTGFGLDVETMREERRLREVLKIWDALHDDDLQGLASMSPSYLASDVCGSHFNNWPLARWRALANRSGWELAGSCLLPLALRLMLADETYRPMFPAGLGELAERLDQARPAGFHKLLLRRAETPVPASEMTLHWTGIYSARFLKSPSSDQVRVVLSSSVFNMSQDWLLTSRQAEALRELVAAGTAPKGWFARWGRSEAAQRILWLWRGFGAVA